MINLFAPKPATDTGIARVKGWVRQYMTLPDDAVVLVTELRCHEAGCPDVETVVAVLGPPGVARHHKLPKPAADVTVEEIWSLAAAGTGL